MSRWYLLFISAPVILSLLCNTPDNVSTLSSHTKSSFFSPENLYYKQQIYPPFPSLRQCMYIVIKKRRKRAPAIPRTHGRILVIVHSGILSLCVPDIGAQSTLAARFVQAEEKSTCAFPIQVDEVGVLGHFAERIRYAGDATVVFGKVVAVELV